MTIEPAFEVERLEAPAVWDESDSDQLPTGQPSRQG